MRWQGEVLNCMSYRCWGQGEELYWMHGVLSLLMCMHASPSNHTHAHLPLCPSPLPCCCCCSATSTAWHALPPGAPRSASTASPPTTPPAQDLASRQVHPHNLGLQTCNYYYYSYYHSILRRSPSPEPQPQPWPHSTRMLNGAYSFSHYKACSVVFLPGGSGLATRAVCTLNPNP